MPAPSSPGTPAGWGRLRRSYFSEMTCVAALGESQFVWNKPANRFHEIVFGERGSGSRLKYRKIGPLSDAGATKGDGANKRAAGGRTQRIKGLLLVFAGVLLLTSLHWLKESACGRLFPAGQSRGFRCLGKAAPATESADRLGHSKNARQECPVLSSLSSGETESGDIRLKTAVTARPVGHPAGGGCPAVGRLVRRRRLEKRKRRSWRRTIRGWRRRRGS
jgi:hypothetical protein